VQTFKRNIKAGQRLEYGIYQFMDHFFGRERMFKLFGKRRRKFYKNLTETLKKGGEGKIYPIERRKDLSLKELKNHYMRKGIPVVMEGAAKDWDCVKKWSLDYFKEMHGDDEALMAMQEDMNSYESTTLAAVIDNIKAGGTKYYRFYPLLDKHPEHLKDFDYQWLLDRKTKLSLFESFQVFIGGKGTISYIHNANPPNFFVQTYGQKDWVLFSQYYTAIIDPDPVRNVYRNAPFRGKDGKPFDAFSPDYSAPNELYKYIDGYSVSLQPGDILWNPPFYWHTVKNASDSIGVGYRWTDPFYSFTIAPLYMFLDLFAIHPPIWKSWRLLKKDNNLVHLAESGQLENYLKQKAEKEKAQKQQAQQVKPVA
jgi:hypothetical protein